MYVQGFLVPVPTDKKQAYCDMAAKVAPIFAEFGAIRTVECWGDEVPDGKVTDMKRAVKAEPDETVVFAWVYWPDKAACDAAAEKMQSDERTMNPPPDMPFDGKRMIYGGFETVLDSGDGGAFGYIDGVVAACPDGAREAFAEFVTRMAGFFREKGARRVIDAWGVDVPDGKVTDFRRAVAAEPGETVIFGWIEWPDKATRDAGMAALMADTNMADNPPPWNGPRAIFGGFTPILDTDHA